MGVRALLLSDGAQRVALVSTDLLVIDERLADAVRQRLAASGLGEVVALLSATHTHSGPGAYGAAFLEKVSLGHYNPQVFQILADTIAGTIQRAADSLQPVQLRAGAARTESLVVNRMREGGAVDDLVRIAAVMPGETTPGGSPLAVAIWFSAHPTTLGAWNQELSADYPGVAVRAIEAVHRGTTGVFLAGAVGDQAPVKRGDGFVPAETLGQAVARAALDALAQSAPRRVDRLRTARRRLALPDPQVRLGRRLRLPAWWGRRLVDDDATLTVVVAGDLALFGVPCDMTMSLAGRLRAAADARGLQGYVTGFADDYIGYCLSEAEYATESYESRMAFHGPQAGDLIVEHLVQMVEGLVSGGQ